MKKMWKSRQRKRGRTLRGAIFVYPSGLILFVSLIFCVEVIEMMEAFRGGIVQQQSLVQPQLQL